MLAFMVKDSAGSIGQDRSRNRTRMNADRAESHGSESEIGSGEIRKASHYWLNYKEHKEFIKFSLSDLCELSRFRRFPCSQPIFQIRANPPDPRSSVFYSFNSFD